MPPCIDYMEGGPPYSAYTRAAQAAAAAVAGKDIFNLFTIK